MKDIKTKRWESDNETLKYYDKKIEKLTKVRNICFTAMINLNCVFFLLAIYFIQRNITISYILAGTIIFLLVYDLFLNKILFKMISTTSKEKIDFCHIV